MTERVAIAPIRRLDGAAAETDQDLVAVEAPLALLVEQPALGAGWRTLGVLMRTPGDDGDLVLGLLYAEGAIRRLQDVVSLSIEPARGEEPERALVTLGEQATMDAVPSPGALASTSACGLCGRLALPANRVTPVGAREPRLSATVIASLPDRLRAAQTVFAETGGLHAAAVFDPAGSLLVLREDVGRHNAVDKVAGALLADGAIPASNLILAVSGRVAYEIVQKAAAAGVAAVVAVGAPTSLAVAAARAASLPLVGFARAGRFNVYSGDNRIAYSGDPP